MNHTDTVIKLLERLEPFTEGQFSGDLSEWPQLKPLLIDLEEFLSIDSMQQELRLLASRNALSKVVECGSIQEADEMIDYLKKFPENLNDKAVIEALEVLKTEFLLQQQDRN